MNKLQPPIFGTQQAVFVKGVTGIVNLSPGGTLYAIRVTFQHGDMQTRNTEIKFELTDSNFVALYATETKPSFWDYPLQFDDILMILLEPIPNVSTVDTYTLRWIANAEVGIKSVTAYHRMML